MRGKRKGVPTIGNRVCIHSNAVVVGNIKIGDDVVIAPNAFVNFDVPDHSIVIGNPGMIKHKENATEGFIGIVAIDFNNRNRFIVIIGCRAYLFKAVASLSIIMNRIHQWTIHIFIEF